MWPYVIGLVLAVLIGVTLYAYFAMGGGHT